MNLHHSPDIGSVAGVVLAGGRSRRFGTEKAIAGLMGRPLIAWVVDALGAVAAPVAISAPAESGAAEFGRRAGLDVIPDRDTRQAGAIAGISSSLIWAQQQGASWLVSQPCDVPLLPQGAWERIIGARRDGRGAFAMTPRGSEPLIAVWPATSVAQIVRVNDDIPIREVLISLGASPVQFDENFTNINHRSDLDALARDLACRGE